MFEQFLARHTNLSGVHVLPLCEGIFTRVVSTRAVTCRTILDFFVVCNKILTHVTNMKIDKNGEHALTKYRTGIVKTDYNMLSLEVNLIFHNDIKHETVKVFNLKKNTCQQNLKSSHQKLTFSLNILGQMKQLKFNSINGKRSFRKLCFHVLASLETDGGWKKQH